MVHESSCDAMKSAVQQNRRGGQAADEPDPETAWTAAPCDAEQITKRHADSPVCKGCDEHWNSGVLQTPECAGARNLEAVEDLKYPGHREKDDGHLLYVSILSIYSSNHVRDREQRDRRACHEHCCQHHADES